MTTRIEPDSHVPIYLQIVEKLRSAIAAGVYRPGEALPSLRVLAADLRVNPNTVQRAYEEMLRQGLIQSHRGVGMFIATRGVRSAQARAEVITQEAFERAIASAAAAGLDLERVQELFGAALAATSVKAR